MSKSPSIWSNPITLVLILLVLVWIFAVAKFCRSAEATQAVPAAPVAVSAVPGYDLLPEWRCPLKLSESDKELAAALLQQYFRMDSLNRQQEAVWKPDPKLDPIFARQYEGNWETYIECIQTLSGDSTGTADKIALIASNFPDNDCQACAPYIGYIVFSMEQGDPATVVIRGSNRALFRFGTYGAIGDQISLVRLGPFQALVFSNTYTGQGQTIGRTTVYKLDDFRPILTVDDYESNGGTNDENLFERKGELYIQEISDPQSPPGLALHQQTTLLNGDPQKVAAPEILYYQYQPDSLRYVQVK